MSTPVVYTPMETVILAGGQGARLGSNRPKPLASIAGQPLLLHLLEMLHASGLRSVSIAVGAAVADFEDQLGMISGPAEAPPAHHSITLRDAECQVRLIQTGSDCDTGGRLRRMAPLLTDRFLMCWADGLCDADLRQMIDFHHSHGRAASVLAVHPPSRFGHLQLDRDRVTHFDEKPPRPDDWINGGIFVLEARVLDLLQSDDCSFERTVLPALAEAGELMAWRHSGYWQCMDTPAERSELDRLATAGQRPWLRRRA